MIVRARRKPVVPSGPFASFDTSENGCSGTDADRALNRSRDRSRRDEPRRDAAPVKQEGESLLAGRDIMGDVIAAERAEATVDHKGDCYRRPIGFNTALIVASDKYTYKARARSRSPDRVKEVVHVAPVVPQRRDD